jgi:pantoate--beta-alanine ligase
MPTPTPDRLLQLTTPEALRRWSLRCHAAGMTVGLVPTMGALHDGHRSLMARARAECDRVVVSIFVNPAQFGPGEDFDRYPRRRGDDLEVLRAEGVHAAFLPSVADMYPGEPVIGIHVGGAMGATLEGERRPGHLDGVALVVTKLLVSARPDRAYFGQKDAQQCAVVRRIAAELDTGVRIVVCPVVRDADGLALSSRNIYLQPEDRIRAPAIAAGLSDAARLFAAGERSAAALATAVRRRLDAVGAQSDYIAVVEPETLSAVEAAAVGCEILVAARIGTTRLIDALRLGIDDPPVARTTD